jgi:hypothetical protein
MAYVLDRQRSGFGVIPGRPIGHPGLADAAAPFGGDPALQQWAIDLSATWASRLATDPSEQQRKAAALQAWLAQDYEATLAGAQKRWGGKKYSTPAIIRAWQISRKQQMDFATLDRSRRLPNTFRPPVGPVQRVVTPLVKGSDKEPVAPLAVAFTQKLLQLHPQARADTYRNHGGVAFNGRGFSIDLWLDGSPKDDRGFYRPEDAVALLRAVHQAARAVGAEWRVLYNDYAVARVINQETGARRVAFIGNARPGGGLNWHGPHPLILHFHLDLAPLPSVAAGALSPMSPISSQPGARMPSGATSIAALPKILAEAVKSGVLTFEVAARILAGERDVPRLTNLVFYARHPTLPPGYKIQPHEQGLARTWLDIRDHVVLPVLHALAVKSSPVAPGSTPAAAHLPQGALGTLVAEVPGRPRFSYAFTPEDLLWTARFLKGEAGGENNSANHAVIWAMFNRYALFTHKYFPTFHQFIRAYSTPLQPVLKSWGAAKRYMHKQTFMRTGGTYAPEHPEVPKGQLQHHLDLQKAPWGSLPQGARIVAEAALKGQLRNPIGLASEFGSTYVYFHDQHGRYPGDEEWRTYTDAYARRKKWVWVGPIPGLNQKSNALFIQAAVAKLPPDTVRVVPPQGILPGQPGAPGHLQPQAATESE